jgi:acyl-CoA thioesterase I
MPRLLKFRYFLLLALLMGCGEPPKEKKDDQTPQNIMEQGEVVSEKSAKTILFFGNSLTAAYGLETDQGFPHHIQKKLDSLGLHYKVINSGVSGETTSGGLNRLDWVLNQDVAIFVLELGANDGLRGIPLSKTKENLRNMIQKVRAKNKEIQIVLAGMQIPPNMGADYTSEFRSIYPDLAEESKVTLIPFLLEGVAGNPELNLEDGIHPNVEGQKIVAHTVWQVLRPLVKEH